MIASNTSNLLKDGTRKRVRYYSCANARKKGATVCHANSIRADEAERLVGQKLLEVLSTPLMSERVIEKMRSQQARLKSESDDLQRNVEGQAVQVASSDVESLLRLVAEVIEGQDKKTLKHLYQLFVDRVTFDKKKKLVWVYLKFDEEIVKQLASYTTKATSTGVAFLHGQKVSIPL